METLRTPLYINPKDNARIKLREPALLIEIAGASPREIPLRRISRLIVSNRVQMTTAVLLACAQRGIIIAIIGPKGKTLARLIGPATDRTHFRQYLDDFCQRPDWREHYDNWLHAMTRRTANIIARRMHFDPAQATHPNAVLHWLSEQIAKTLNPEQKALFEKHLHHLAILWMQQRLLKMGIGAQDERWLAGKPDLAYDLGTLLNLRYWPISLAWLKSKSRQNTPLHNLNMAQITQEFHAQALRVERLGTDIINRFHQWLIEWQ